MNQILQRRSERDVRRVQTYLDIGNVAAAEVASESLVRQFPDEANAWYWHSIAARAIGRLKRAAAAARRATDLDAGNVEYWGQLARSEMSRGETTLALLATRRLVALGTESAPLLDEAGSILAFNGEFEGALVLFQQAVAVDPDHPLFQYHLARALDRVGQAIACENALEEVIAAHPRYARAHWSLANLQTWSAENNHLERLLDVAGQAMSSAEEQGLLELALHKEWHDLDERDAAFAALERANQALHRIHGGEGDFEAKLFEDLERSLSVVGELPEETLDQVDDAPVPIFIVGLPRTGTSVVERVLGNHPEVRHAGEMQEFSLALKDVMRLDSPAFVDERMVQQFGDVDWRRVGAAYRSRLKRRFGPGGYVTDKLPSNYLFAHVIAKALPEARIVHVIRDPMDTCFAIYRQFFGSNYPYSYQQHLVAEHFVRYAGWMRRIESALPKRVLPLRYEQLVSVPGLVTRALYRFCGLDWIDGAEDPTRNQKPVATANPVSVRERIHGRRVGSALAYSEYLEPMRKVLFEAGLVARDPA